LGAAARFLPGNVGEAIRTGEAKGVVPELHRFAERLLPGISP
jgi:hypothetical protein